MKAKLTRSFLAGLETTGKAYEVHDTSISGLFVRVTAAGHKAYVVRWARGKKKTLGRVEIVTLERARTEALRYLSEAREHGEPLSISQARTEGGIPTLKDFLADHFEAWAESHQKDGHNSVRAIRKSFADLLSLRLDEIDQRSVEQLRTSWLQSGNKPATANRHITRLQGVLSRAVEWGILTDHPLAKLRRLKVDMRGRVRFLSDKEKTSLYDAMDQREKRIRDERDSANLWRKERNKEELPNLHEVEFADHLKPLVILSINTGMRQGEVFNLKWCDINFSRKVVTVEGKTSKSGQTRHIPLNIKTFDTVRQWKVQSGASSEYVFPGKYGGRLDNIQSSWERLLELADIKDFRWHDLRHTFASSLVMKGVPLNVVRELLGHSDIMMTLRYAHLAPDTKATAVELI